MARKAGIEFRPAIIVGPDITGIANTFSGKYRLEGALADAWTDFPTAFSEEKPGVYSSPLTIATEGVYLISISSTDTRIDDSDGYVTVTAASIDDVATAIANAQADITSIKGQVDILDEATVNTIKDAVVAVDDKLVELTGLVSDVNDPAIVSLRELLNDITSAGSARDSVIGALSATLVNATDDLEAMVRGDEFLSDGTTANPFHGKATKDIYDKLVDTTNFLHGSITEAKNVIITNADNNKAEILNAITTAQNVVEANKGLLESSTSGLQAIKNAVDALSSANGDDTAAITAILEDANTGLAAIKTAIMDKLVVIEGKIDTIVANQTSRTTHHIIM